MPGTIVPVPVPVPVRELPLGSASPLPPVEAHGCHAHGRKGQHEGPAGGLVCGSRRLGLSSPHSALSKRFMEVKYGHTKDPDHKGQLVDSPQCRAYGHRLLEGKRPGRPPDDPVAPAPPRGPSCPASTCEHLHARRWVVFPTV